MTTKTLANHIHKVRALLAKTTANGCTPREAASALDLAATIVAKHKLNPADFIWPEPPTGYHWEGECGRGGTVVETPVQPQPSNAEKPKREPKLKADPKQPRVIKKALIIEMMRRPDGVTVAQLIDEFDILAHSARAILSVYGREIGGVTYDRATKVYRAAP